MLNPYEVNAPHSFYTALVCRTFRFFCGNTNSRLRIGPLMISYSTKPERGPRSATNSKLLRRFLDHLVL